MAKAKEGKRKTAQAVPPEPLTTPTPQEGDKNTEAVAERTEQELSVPPPPPKENVENTSGGDAPKETESAAVPPAVVEIHEEEPGELVEDPKSPPTTTFLNEDSPEDSDEAREKSRARTREKIHTQQEEFDKVKEQLLVTLTEMTICGRRLEQALSNGWSAEFLNKRVDNLQAEVFRLERVAVWQHLATYDEWVALVVEVRLEAVKRAEMLFPLEEVRQVKPVGAPAPKGITQEKQEILKELRRILLETQEEASPQKNTERSGIDHPTSCKELPGVVQEEQRKRVMAQEAQGIKHGGTNPPRSHEVPYESTNQRMCTEASVAKPQEEATPGADSERTGLQQEKVCNIISSEDEHYKEVGGKKVVAKEYSLQIMNGGKNTTNKNSMFLGTSGIGHGFDAATRRALQVIEEKEKGKDLLSHSFYKSERIWLDPAYTKNEGVSESYVKRLVHTKIPVFSGDSSKNESVTTWIMKAAHTLFVVAGVPANKAVAVCLGAFPLMSTARLWVLNLREAKPDLSFDDLAHSMVDRFHSPTRSEEAEENLFKLYQGDTPIEIFIDEHSRLWNKVNAFQSEDSRTRDCISKLNDADRALAKWYTQEVANNGSLAFGDFSRWMVKEDRQRKLRMVADRAYGDPVLTIHSTKNKKTREAAPLEAAGKKKPKTEEIDDRPRVPCDKGCKAKSHPEGVKCPSARFRCHACQGTGHFARSKECPRYQEDFVKGSRNKEIAEGRKKFAQKP